MAAMTNVTEVQLDDLIKQKAFDQGTKVAQIFSGIFFAGLAIWLTTANGGSLSFVQRAALEKRLTVCCFINMYVSMFSTFFNIFQLTNVDDAILPVPGGFTLDLARPIEWVLTCPLMQLSLVLMGGAKLPDYRRYLMPSFSISILMCGTTAAFMPIVAVKILMFVVGVTLFVTMASFNRLQIIEYSNGAEGLTTGDSEFRKATLLLLTTWAPFPTWFVMSPEGFGIITNVLVIQVGWAFLNIVSKFTFIFYIQRIKDLYCNRLKTKRELTGNANGNKKMFGVSGGGMHGSMSPPDFEMGGQMMMNGMDTQAYELADKEAKREKLNAVVIETMNFLGMAQNTDRFVRLLEKADVICIADVEKLNQEKCEKLSLPFELVQALQKRVKVWKMDLVDEAEQELERGEEHYIKKLMEMPQGDHQMQMQMQMPMPNMMPYGPQESGNGVGISAVELEDMLQKMEERILGNQMQQLGQHESQQQKPQSNNMNMNADVQMAVFFEKMQAMVASVEERLTQRIEATSKTSEHRAELRSFENRMSMKIDDKAREHHEDLTALEQRIIAQVEQKVGSVSTTVDTCCQKVDLCFRKIDSSSIDVSGRFTEKLDAQCKSHLEVLQSVKDSHAKTSAEGEVAWRQRFEELQNYMVCRLDEQDAVHKKRYDELIRQSAAKRIEELTSQVHNSSEASTSASKELGETIASELGSLTSKLTMKLETMHTVHTKHHTEADAALQR
eukprot:CAMPEP_0203854946 /NCGR_PEP_ID=MMETSP0359-20131031/9366_1 /ASSEMBLY_ACC=CAM_ASM_000338 /TAXON_ID=268821 /ORGANISM="Scrippsiella Hangoei, Strain SHTV-5" /LENGTH=726 /DNA_ID=CAMNT_0050771453 /DNA_START=48 /DNA_END=2224 /DNA_ORIENTATION=+